MSSGIKPNACLGGILSNMQMRRKDQGKEKCRKLLVLKIDQTKEKPDIIEDEDFCPEEAIKEYADKEHMSQFKSCLLHLPKNEGRYLVYDYEYETSAGAKNSKMISVLWCPNDVPIKQKMMYAASKDALKGLVASEIPQFQADCIDDCEEKAIESKLNRN